MPAVSYFVALKPLTVPYDRFVVPINVPPFLCGWKKENTALLCEMLLTF